MIRFLLCVVLLTFPQIAHAQFDFWGAAQKVLKTSRPILTQGENTAPTSTQSASSIAHSAFGSLSNRDIEAGLRQALSLSATKVTNQLGTANGFYGDSAIKIPLPDKLQTAHKMLSQVGLESLGNDLELKMNRAAELAMPQVQKLFISSIKKMTLNDAKNILGGGDNAATQFFRGTMGDDLITALRPIIDNKLSEVRGVQTYNQLAQQYGNIPFAPRLETDLTGYVANFAMDGMFNYMAKEEAAIRANPVERSTALLQKVFAAYQ